MCVCVSSQAADFAFWCVIRVEQREGREASRFLCIGCVAGMALHFHLTVVRPQPPPRPLFGLCCTRTEFSPIQFSVGESSLGVLFVFNFQCSAWKDDV